MIDEILGRLTGGNKKKTPLLIMEKHSEIMFLDKKLSDMRKRHKKELGELEAVHKKEHTENWAKITDFLAENGYIKEGTDPNLSIRDGVMYLIEDENE